MFYLHAGFLCAGVLLVMSVPVWLAMYTWSRQPGQRMASTTQESLWRWMKPRMIITVMYVTRTFLGKRGGIQRRMHVADHDVKFPPSPCTHALLRAWPHPRVSATCTLVAPNPARLYDYAPPHTCLAAVNFCCTAVCFNFYPGVTERVLSVFQCTEIDIKGTPYDQYAQAKVRPSPRTPYCCLPYSSFGRGRSGLVVQQCKHTLQPLLLFTAMRQWRPWY